jgi:hypothetical protein
MNFRQYFMKLPHTIRFFRKPDHLSFLVGFPLLLSVLATNIFELKIACFISFSFTLIYEIFEISKGGRDIYKLDHFTFVFAYALIIISFVYDNLLILPIATILMSFTLSYEIYRVRKLDLKNMREKRK